MRHIGINLLAELQRMLVRSRWAGALGAGLCIFALMFDFVGNRTLREDIAVLRLERKTALNTTNSSAPHVASAREQIDQFYTHLPTSNQLPEVLLQIHDLAHEHNVQALRADYRNSEERATPMLRVRVNIPAQGEYSALRAWVADVLQKVPGAALEELELRRENIAQTQLEAQARFVLFVRRGR